MKNNRLDKDLAELLALTLVLSKDILNLSERQNKCLEKINDLLDCIPESQEKETDKD